MGVTEALYKVLASGQSCDGGTHRPRSPPRGPRTGRGRRVRGTSRRLAAGRDVPQRVPPDDRPAGVVARWARSVPRRVVRGRGQLREDKVACRRVRLLRPVTAGDVLRDLGVRLLRGAVSDDQVYGDGYGSGTGTGTGTRVRVRARYGYGYGSGTGTGTGRGRDRYRSGDRGQGTGTGTGMTSSRVTV